MNYLQKLLWKLLAAIACCLIILWPPIALAQTNQPNPTAESTPTVQTNQPASAQTNQRPSPTDQQVKQSSKQNAPAQSRRGKTYEQAPNPYNMDAIETYDQELYGEGR
ncbi:MAG: hypothetical protein AAFZ49_12110 [Cyanobacteria bacterium J06659_2]